jgi:hypothetical protein
MQDDFYEILLYDADGTTTLNEKFIQAGYAENVLDTDRTPKCLLYPSFEMLEKHLFYPSFAERVWMLEKRGIDFNSFEENNLPMIYNSFGFENELGKILNQENNYEVKKILLKLWQF